MKKITAMLLCLAMLFAFAGCGSKDSSSDGSDAKVVTIDEVEKTVPAKMEKVEKANFKIGLICLHDENSTYDNNFIQALKTAQAELGLKDDQVLIKTNIEESSACYEAAAQLADDGCNVIFADSFGHESFMIQAAQEYPDVQFCHATGTKAHTEKLDNYHNAFANIFEGRFLGGVAAGLKLNEMIDAGEFTAEEAKVGYIGAFPYAEVVSGMTSFFLGVRYVCPSATMDVTFTNSWYDPTLEQEGAVKLINNDCKLISLHADSMGAPTECQNNGVPFVFYNGSAKDACPDTYIVASYINWAPYMTYSMKATMNGEAIDADWVGTLENGGVALKELNEAVAAEGTAAKLEEVKAALLDGSLKVFDTTTFTVGGETLTSYMADVDDMGDFVPETEAVADGYFHESESRSAPYFDMFIDGITNLDA